MIKVTSYSSDQKATWDQFVKEGDNSVFVYERDFMEYHRDRFTDSSLMVYEEGELIAVFPANIKDATVYSHQGLTYGGLVMKERRLVKKMIACFHAVISFLKEKNVKTIVYKPVPDYFCRTVNDTEHFILNLLEAKVLKVDTGFMIDYRDELKFQERRRRSAKKGEKHKTTVAIQDEFGGFWNDILIPNLRDKFGSAPVHSLEEIELLHQRFPEKIKQANAFIDETLVAGATLFDFGRTIHCQYISSNDFGRDSGAIDLLFDHLIKMYAPEKKYFSFGTANNHGNDINIGLSEWKEGWGSKIRAHFHYAFETDKLTALEKFLN